MDEFFQKEKSDESKCVTASKKDKKRKAEAKPPIDDETRKRAQFYCTCPEQWRTVSRYNKERLEQFVQENEFRQQQQLQLQVFDFAQKSIAFLADKLSAGNGYVQREIENDASLRSAIVVEAGNFVQLLSNKVKLLVLLGTDTMTGKMNQRLHEPPSTIHISEENANDNVPIFFGQIPEQAAAEAPSSTGKVGRDSVCLETVDHLGSGEKRSGEIDDDRADPPGPEGA